MVRILITGGSGFIGQNVQQYFFRSGGVEMKNIDLLPPSQIQLRTFWIQCDICSFDPFKRIVLAYNPDYIIHLAARTDLDGKSIQDYSANTIGVENLLKIVQLLPNLKKVIITSSMLVCHTGYYPKNQFDYAPSTLYGKSKVITERLVWENQPQCDWAIVRPTSIWGPWFKVPYKNFFDMVIAHRYFHIGHKSCTKTYGYVGNTVYQIVSILLNTTDNKDKKIFYLGDNPATNIEEWANEIAAELHYKIIRLPWWILKMAAWGGDLLKLVGLHFPMTSFRLRNMTTDNILDLSNTYEIAPDPPYNRIEGIRNTLKWIYDFDKKA